MANNTYILLDVLSCKYRWVLLQVVPYFGEPVGRVKIQTTSKNSQRYYTAKRLITDLLSHTTNFYVHVREYFADMFTVQLRYIRTKMYA